MNQSKTKATSIDLVLCSEQSDAVTKYSALADRKQIFSAKYLPYLPTELELKEQVEIARKMITAG